MNIYVDLYRLRSCEYQADGRLTKAHVDWLVADMSAKGQIDPIKITPDFEIIDGHNRWAAAKLLGWTKIKATIQYGNKGQVFASALYGTKRGKSEDFAEAIAKGLPISYLPNPHLRNAEECLRLGISIDLIASVRYPLTIWKLAEKTRDRLNDRLGENLSTKTVAEGMIRNRARALCELALKLDRYPAKKVLSALKKRP